MNRARSLREYDSLADRIRHSRQGDGRDVLIVEGPSDARLIERVAAARYSIFPAGGRTPSVAELRRTRELGVQRVVAIVDRDFDSVVEEAKSEGLPICSVEAADLEAQLIVDHLFTDVLRELGAAARTTDAVLDEVNRQAAFGAGVVGILRLHGQTHELSLAFDEIDLRGKIDKDDLSLKMLSFAQSAVRGSDLQVDTALEIMQAGSVELAETLTEAGVGAIRFRGRDAIAFGAVALMRKLGRLSLQQVDVGVLEGALRLLAHRSPGIIKLLDHVDRELAGSAA